MDQSLGEDPDAAADQPRRHAVDQRAEALRPCVGVLRVATKSRIVRVHGVPARGRGEHSEAREGQILRGNDYWEADRDAK